MLIKKYLTYIALVLSIAFLLALVVFKNRMSDHLTQAVQKNVSSNISKEQGQKVDSLYNYTKNGKLFEITFLEFGAAGCAACRKMEKVMQNIQVKYSTKVNVVFVNVLLPENQPDMKYFGIVEIPTQILLNRDGIPFFRHSGYIETNHLMGEIEKQVK